MDYKKVLKFLIGLSLFVFTIKNSWESIERFNDRTTAFSVKKVKDPNLTHSGVTLCSTISKKGLTMSNILYKSDPDQILTDQYLRTLFYSKSELGLSIHPRQPRLQRLNITEEEFFTMGGGHCFTFRIQGRAKSGEEHGVDLKLRIPGDHLCWNNSNASSRECPLKFPLFFHDNDGFIYNAGHDFLGLDLEYGEIGRTSFYPVYKKNITNLDTETNHCDRSQTMLGWHKCLSKYAEKTRKCRLPWTKSNQSETRLCRAEELARDKSFDGHMTYLNEDSLGEMSQCLKPCFFVDHEVVKNKFTHVDNYTADDEMSFVIFLGSNRVEVKREYFAFDILSLVGELGGTLGLFLGWSIYPALAGFIDTLDGFIKKLLGRQPL